jgi:hypothetical protein
VSAISCDQDGLLEYEGRTYELTVTADDEGFLLELDDVSEDDRCTLLIGRVRDGGQSELLSLENRGVPAPLPRFVPLQLVDFFLAQLRTM